ncbi:hypothetical protein [Streptomyces filipinensis]|uniref:hypothetical protein n=1 Tax=Streptomyces filipinensis TaxID=66887 RepID=UPI001783930B|nr:hypothetical protein [Streptomyces filipinensis]
MCGRKGRGKDSANHLFTKAHLASWLRARDIAAEFIYPELRGSAVVVHLEDGRTVLVHLDRNRPVDWDGGVWETILGPGVGVPPGPLAQRGYVHRIRFDDRPGGGRTMQFGTEVPGEGTTCGGSASTAACSGGRVSKSISPQGDTRAEVPSIVVVMFMLGVPPSGGW